MTRLISTFGFLAHTPLSISTRGFAGGIPSTPVIQGVISRQRGNFPFHKAEDKNFKIAVHQRNR